MNVTLRGKTKHILEEMVKEGYANTLSEAVRLAIINFRETHEDEIDLVNRKLDKIDREIKEGKRKVINSKQALGRYSKYLE